MAAQCPFLGMAGSRHQVFGVASSRHRCHLRGQPERISTDCQSMICLTTAYRRCPRLLVDAPDSARPAWLGDQSAVLYGGRGSLAPRSSLAALSADTAGSTAPYTGLRRLVAHPPRKPRHVWTVTELAVLALGFAILLAFSFIGYVIVYRLQGGPVMGALPGVAELPTLVPTFTPWSSVAVPLQVGTGEPPLPGRPPATSPPTRLVISKIGIDIPVVPVGSKTVTEQGEPTIAWDALPDAAGFHLGSAYPGNPGNTVINGHRDIEGAVFRHLDWITAGDQIAVYVGEAPYPYTVTEKVVVPEVFASSEQRAESLKLIGYMPEERLTLVTCTPVGLATHRLVVIAKPTDEATE